jgi:hypothetical protein
MSGSRFEDKVMALNARAERIERLLARLPQARIMSGYAASLIRWTSFRQSQVKPT